MTSYSKFFKEAGELTEHEAYDFFTRTVWTPEQSDEEEDHAEKADEEKAEGEEEPTGEEVSEKCFSIHAIELISI